MEHAQEFLRRAVEPGPSRHLEPSALLDELTLLQKSHRVRAVHTAHLIDIGARGRLIIGNDGQHLQRGLRELRGLSDLKRFADDVRVIRRGAELIAVLHPHQTDAAALEGVVVAKLLQNLLRRRLVQLERQTDAVDIHRLAGGKEMPSIAERTSCKSIVSSAIRSSQCKSFRCVLLAVHRAVGLAARETDHARAAQLQHRHKRSPRSRCGSSRHGTAAKARDTEALEPPHDLARLVGDGIRLALHDLLKSRARGGASFSARSKIDCMASTRSAFSWSYS